MPMRTFLVALVLLSLLVGGENALAKKSSLASKRRQYLAALARMNQDIDAPMSNSVIGAANANSQRLWDAGIGPILGGARPNFNIVTPGDKEDLGGQMSSYNNGPVNLSATALWALATPGMGAPTDTPPTGYFTYNLPHEWAHTRQIPGVFADEPLAEGGAAAFAEEMRNQGMFDRANFPILGNFLPNAGYEPFLAQVRPRGLDWILRGQFGRG